MPGGDTFVHAIPAGIDVDAEGRVTIPNHEAVARWAVGLARDKPKPVPAPNTNCTDCNTVRGCGGHNIDCGTLNIAKGCGGKLRE